VDIDDAELEKVPYLDLCERGSRRVYLMPLWDGENWHLYLPGPNGLVDITSVKPIHIDYVAK